MIVIISAKLFSIQSETYGEHLTLTLGVATWIFGSAHHVIMVIISAKLFFFLISDLKVMEWTQNVDFLTLNL
jgi:hypothetical protein